MMWTNTKETMLKQRRASGWWQTVSAVIMTAACAGAWLVILPDSASAKTIYSYVDERYTTVITDDFETIPKQYRDKVKVIEEGVQGAPSSSPIGKLQQKVDGLSRSGVKGFDRLTPKIKGATHYQSQVLTLGGLIILVSLILRAFVRSEVIRFLSLWCMIMSVLVVPALYFTSQDAPLDRIRGTAGKIQDKQIEHLQGTR